MRVYLDDDSASGLLTRLLRQAGHDVQIPNDVGLAGQDDVIHLTHAVREDRVCLSGNYHDFRNLHNLVIQVTGSHPGIMIVRRDNDPKRDLTPRGIVQAIEKVLAADITIREQFIILNQWR